MTMDYQKTVKGIAVSPKLSGRFVLQRCASCFDGRCQTILSLSPLPLPTRKISAWTFPRSPQLGNDDDELAKHPWMGSRPLKTIDKRLDRRPDVFLPRR